MVQIHDFFHRISEPGWLRSLLIPASWSWSWLEMMTGVPRSGKPTTPERVLQFFEIKNKGSEFRNVEGEQRREDREPPAAAEGRRVFVGAKQQDLQAQGAHADRVEVPAGGAAAPGRGV